MQDLKVIYEDNHIIVVEKIPNVPSQSDKTGDMDMLTLVKGYIKEKYNFVPKGYYKKTYLTIGIAMGPTFGLLFGALLGKIGIGLPLGIPIGLAIGIAIGTNLDKKAIFEKRVIN